LTGGVFLLLLLVFCAFCLFIMHVHKETIFLTQTSCILL
jgi:hypothetical protein